MNDSPVGLAAYILEKFSTWTDLKNRDLAAGGLERYKEFSFALLEVVCGVINYKCGYICTGSSVWMTS